MTRTTEGPAPRAILPPRGACRICARNNQALVRFRFGTEQDPGPLRTSCKACVAELVEGLAGPSKSCLRCWRLRANLQAAILLNASDPWGVPVLPEPLDAHRRGCPRLGI